MAASNMQLGKRVSLISILVSALLAVGKVIVGWLAGSTSVVADGVEAAGDVVASGAVLLGFIIADPVLRTKITHMDTAATRL